MKSLTHLWFFLALCITSTYTIAVEVGGRLKLESAYSYLSDSWHKQNLAFELELSQAFEFGEVTLIGLANLDNERLLNTRDVPNTYAEDRALRYETLHGSAELRELYWTHGFDDTYWVVGKQQVVWGEADGLKLLDVINPQNYREFILKDTDDSRIPLWMVNVEQTLSDGSVLQVLWIPDTTGHNLAPQHSPFVFSSPMLVPKRDAAAVVSVQEVKAPSGSIKNSDFAIRLASFSHGWDYTLNYLYHYIDDPVLYLAEPRGGEESGEAVMLTSYERSHLIGASASTAIDDWIIRLELAYETDRYHRSQERLPGVLKANQSGSVIGLDYQGWTDQLVSFQWFQSRVQGQENKLVKEAREDVMTLTWEHKFMNETLSLRLNQLYSLTRHDALTRARLAYNLSTNLDIYVGLDRFNGDQRGLFGQFDQADRAFFGLEWGF